MRKIIIKFVDQWTGHRPEQDKIYHLLCKHYSVELGDDPDYLFDGGLGHEHIRYDCVKIVTVGENIVPDFNFFDYAVGFDHLQFGDRYLRIPLFVFNDEFADLAVRDKAPGRDALLNRKFCSYVVSNGSAADPFREEFFHRLGQYKRIDSGGRFMNNVGGPVPDKAAFCRQYKFNIAFENCRSPGYTTEKIVQPLSYFSIPIYYGDPLVGRDFLPECMVRVASRDDMDRAIEEIVRLDRDDGEYLKRATAPCLVRPVYEYDNLLEEFLVHIVEQPRSEARRLNRFGFQPVLRKRQARLLKMDDAMKRPVRLLRRIMGR